MLKYISNHIGVQDICFFLISTDTADIDKKVDTQLEHGGHSIPSSNTRKFCSVCNLQKQKAIPCCAVCNTHLSRYQKIFIPQRNKLQLNERMKGIGAEGAGKRKKREDPHLPNSMTNSEMTR